MLKGYYLLLTLARMPDQHLTSYIQAQVAKGAGRAEISPALIAAGWSSQDINMALVSLGVPMTAAAASVVLDPAPAAPIAATVAAATSMPSQNTNVPEGSFGPPIYVPPVNMPYSAPQTTHVTPAGVIPSGWNLVKQALKLYRERLALFGTLGMLQMLPIIVLGFIFYPYTTAPGASERVHSLMMGLTSASFLTYVLLGIVAFLIYSVYSCWCTAALMLAVHKESERLTFASALSQAASMVLPVFLVSALYGFIVIGVVIAAVVAMGVLALGGLAAHLTAGLLLIGIPLIGIPAVITIIFVAIRYQFALWMVITRNERGFQAFAQSSALVTGRMGLVFSRGIGIGIGLIPVGIVLAIVGGIVSFTATLTAGVFAPYITTVIRMLIQGAIQTPLLLIAMYLLLQALMQTRPAPTPTKSSAAMSLAVVGGIATIVLLVGGFYASIRYESQIKDFVTMVSAKAAARTSGTALPTNVILEQNASSTQP